MTTIDSKKLLISFIHCYTNQLLQMQCVVFKSWFLASLILRKVELGFMPILITSYIFWCYLYMKNFINTLKKIKLWKIQKFCIVNILYNFKLLYNKDFYVLRFYKYILYNFESDTLTGNLILKESLIAQMYCAVICKARRLSIYTCLFLVKINWTE